MALETEVVLDRRRLRRRTALWRSLAILAVVAALAAWALTSAGGAGLLGNKHIARVTLQGMITENRDQLRMLKKIAKSEQVAGVILFVNSPGGTTTGGEALFQALRRVAETKPVVAQFGTVAASAAYIAGMGTDYIVARGNSITGSVGVLVQWPEVSGLMEKIGVKINELKSGPLKATPSPFQPLDEAGREVTQQMITESQQWFLGLVKARRKIDTANVPGLEEGRVFSGREALKYKLIDALGGEAEAVRWLETEHNVKKGTRVVDWRPQPTSSWPFGLGVMGGFRDDLSEAVRGGVAAALDRAGLSALRLDGLVSVWQPRKN